MSYKMKLTDEYLSIFKTLSSMCPRVHILQHNGITNLLHFDEQNLTIIYRAQIFDTLFDDKEDMQFTLGGLKQIIGDVAYLKKELPEFTVDDAIKSMHIKHSKGSMDRMFIKLMEEKNKHDEKIDGFIKKVDEYAFQLVVNESEFTHFKKRVMSVDGVTSDGYVKFSCDPSVVKDVEFTTKEGKEVKPCYVVNVYAVGRNKESVVNHELFSPVEETEFNSPFEIKINAKDLNKVKANSKSDIKLGFALKNGIVNKVEFKESFPNSETSVFIMKMKEDNAQ